MRASFLTISAIFLLNSFNPVYSQSEAAIPFLWNTPAPLHYALGYTGVSHPNDDPFGFYYNPAMLGYSGRTNNFSAQFYPGTVDWLDWDMVEYNSYAFNAGYNFDEISGIGLSAGAGFIHSSMDFGLNNEDSYNAFGLGVSLDYCVSLSLGLTYKTINSKMGSRLMSVSVDANALDYGILIYVPVSKLIADYSFTLSPGTAIIPVFNYSIGYSRSNIGDEVYYIDPEQSDALPLTARLGNTFQFAFDMNTGKSSLNLINYNLVIEADDILIDRQFNEEGLPEEISYQGLLGDIEIFKNLIKLEGTDKVVVHKGHMINLLETVSVLRGSFAGRGFSINRKTDGIMISTRGIFKVLDLLADNNILKYISDHFEIRYISSSIFTNSPQETDLSGISVHLFNFLN